MVDEKMAAAAWPTSIAARTRSIACIIPRSMDHLVDGLVTIQDTEGHARYLNIRAPVARLQPATMCSLCPLDLV